MKNLIVCGLWGIFCTTNLFSNAQVSQNTLQWIPGKWYERLGSAEEEGPISGVVYAPSNVIDYASRILDGKPSTWHVRHEMEWATFSQETFPQHVSDIVSIRDHNDNALVFLIMPDKWIRLNSPESIGAINYVLEDNIHPFKTLDHFPWPTYILSLSKLYRGDVPRAVLVSNFLQESDSAGVSKFYLGSQKDIGVLRSLCIDPIVLLNNSDFNVTANILTGKGSVERWTISFRFNKSVEITKIEITDIYPVGSFTYGIDD